MSAVVGWGGGFVDPRRRIDEKDERILSSRIPFIEMHLETELEAQALGEPLRREVIVIRINRSDLKLYSALLGFTAVLVIATLLWS